MISFSPTGLPFKGFLPPPPPTAAQGEAREAAGEEGE